MTDSYPRAEAAPSAGLSIIGVGPTEMTSY